jgi:hypothetical protein
VTSADDEDVKALAVGLIRSVNSSVVQPSDTDADLLFRYGEAAEPLARALRDVIRAEVARAHD